MRISVTVLACLTFLVFSFYSQRSLATGGIYKGCGYTTTNQICSTCSDNPSTACWCNVQIWVKACETDDMNCISADTSWTSTPGSNYKVYQDTGHCSWRMECHNRDGYDKGTCGQNPNDPLDFVCNLSGPLLYEGSRTIFVAIGPC